MGEDRDDIDAYEQLRLHLVELLEGVNQSDVAREIGAYRQKVNSYLKGDQKQMDLRFVDQMVRTQGYEVFVDLVPVDGGASRGRGLTADQLRLEGSIRRLLSSVGELAPADVLALVAILERFQPKK